MKKMTNLLSNTEPGDVSKKQLMTIYGTEFQREITLNNSQLLSILIILIDKTSTNQPALDKTHLLEPLDILKQPIKLNLFQVSMETLTSIKLTIEIHSEKLMVKIIKEQIHTPLKNQLLIISVISLTDSLLPVKQDLLPTVSDPQESYSDLSTKVKMVSLIQLISNTVSETSELKLEKTNLNN
jgi:hypothetical protein